MRSAPTEIDSSVVLGEPAWDIARLFPNQGAWTEEEYLELDGNYLVEFSHGVIEVLPMPTTIHQIIAFYLARVLHAFVEARQLGLVLPAPLPVRLWTGKFREPDVVFMASAHLHRAGKTAWEGADLVVEVVSDNDRSRDLETKRTEYPKAGIAEYWIVDPLLEQITVLKLEGEKYLVHGEFKKGEQARSALLPDFAVDVTTALAGK